MTKHTPTPWRNVKNRHNSRMTTIGNGNYGGIAETAGHRPDLDENEANAALIVRAVNSHAALVAALANFCEWYANHFEDFASDVNAELLCLDNEARAALAKATTDA